MSETPRTATADEVPVLDLAPLIGGADLTGLARQLREACTATGFFYVRQHGIDPGLSAAAFAATRRYFALPLAERLPHRIDQYMRGFMPQGINQHPGFVPDRKESFEIGMDLPPDHPDVVAGLPLHGPNRWPAELPWLRAAAEPYFAATHALGRALLRLFAVSLDMPEGYFLQWCRIRWCRCGCSITSHSRRRRTDSASPRTPTTA